MEFCFINRVEGKNLVDELEVTWKIGIKSIWCGK